MNKYVYTDKKTKEIVFCVYAENILKADAQFQFTVGTDPNKNPFVGCEIAFDKSGKIE